MREYGGEETKNDGGLAVCNIKPKNSTKYFYHVKCINRIGLL